MLQPDIQSPFHPSSLKKHEPLLETNWFTMEHLHTALESSAQRIPKAVNHKEKR
jgi:hypothetical protein